MISRSNIFDYSPAALTDYFCAIGEGRFRAGQLMKWLYQKRITDFMAMTTFNKELRSRLNQEFSTTLPELSKPQDVADGTAKWLLRLEGGSAIESVFIPDDKRGTLCVSSQAGCALNCSFCATGKQGFARNLATHEIIAQLWLLQEVLVGRGKRITNVVLMGMGEPLLNYQAVLSALQIMLDDNCFGLSKRKVTLSTAGVIPRILQLKEDCPVSLAVSLHAVHDDLRNELVPLNKKYPIGDLLQACKAYVAGRRQSMVTFEYVMLRGINDTIAEARALAKLLRHIPAKVNLIPFNSFPASDYECSDDKQIDRFRAVLIAAGITTITRKSRGRKIAAACGQLTGDILDRTRRSERLRLPSTLDLNVAI